MDKLEKVIKGFDVCKNLDGCCDGCPYFKDEINLGEDDCMREQLMPDALELLKEQQERIKVLEEEAKTKGTPQKVLNRKVLADLLVGECPLCGALFNNEICPVSCGWCGCLLDWKDGDGE